MLKHGASATSDLHVAGGVFPTTGPLGHSTLQRWFALYRDACSWYDAFWIWMPDHELGWCGDQLGQWTPRFYQLNSLSPDLFDPPYTGLFCGKHVVVVSPFHREIVAQYKRNRLRIFPRSPRHLPPFRLTAIHAPLPPTGDTGNRTWFV